MQLPNIYASKNYKRLVFIPLACLLIAVFFIPRIPAGIDLRGGVLITIQTTSQVNLDDVKTALVDGLGVHEVSVKTAPSAGGGTGVEIEIEQNEKLAAAEIALRHFYEAYVDFTKADFEVASLNASINSGNATDLDRLKSELADAEARRSVTLSSMNSYAETVKANVEPFVGQISISNDMDAGKMKDALSTAYAEAKSIYKERVLSILRSKMDFTEFTYKDVSPSLSEFFLQKTIQVVIISFILTAVVVVAVFRSLVPSFAVMFGAMNDIIFALGAMGLFGIPMTLASLGALLMLIGYSLDTDILLTSRIMKRTEGTPQERAYGAMKTGMLMTTTTILSFGVLFILSMLTQLSTYYQISAVAICGLIGDLIATWCTNAVIVLWSVESKAGKI